MTNTPSPPSSPLRLVRQRNRYDCGVAALAMLGKVTYDKALSMTRDPSIPCTPDDVPSPDAFYIVHDAGNATSEREVYLGLNTLEVAFALWRLGVPACMCPNPNATAVRPTWLGAGWDFMSLPKEEDIIEAMRSHIVGFTHMYTSRGDPRYHWAVIAQSAYYDPSRDFVLYGEPAIDEGLEQWREGITEEVILVKHGGVA